MSHCHVSLAIPLLMHQNPILLVKGTCIICHYNTAPVRSVSTVKNPVLIVKDPV